MMISKFVRTTIALAVIAPIVTAYRQPAVFARDCVGDYCGVDAEGYLHRFAGSGNMRWCGTLGTGNCHASWEGGSCSDAIDGHIHPLCGGSTPAPEDVVLAVQLRDVSAARRLLARTDGAVRFNHLRKSLQLYNCQGRIVANVPVSAELASALE